MKKLFIVLALACVSMTTMAQEEDPALKHSVATNGFWNNWFVQGNVSWNAFYSNEERGAGFAKSPFKDFRSALGFSVAVGKWFTPGIGLRTKFSALNGRSVISENKANNEIKFWNLQEQALFNLSNMFCGYSDTRVWNIMPYAGVGIARNCSYNTYSLVGSAGLLNTFKISKRVLLNLDLGFNMCGDDFEGRLGQKRYVDLGGKGGNPSPSNHDRWFTAEIGVTYNIGRTGWNKTPDVDAIKALSQSQLDALNAQLSDANDEIARLKARKPEVIRDTTFVSQSFKDFITTPVSVFFNLGKINVANLKDLVNVQALAKYAKENNSNLLVTGYADSATGSPAINERLSRDRAETVKGELIKMGVSESKIRTAHNGGVNELGQTHPKEFDRRATVQIVED